MLHRRMLPRRPFFFSRPMRGEGEDIRKDICNKNWIFGKKYANNWATSRHDSDVHDSDVL